MRRVKYRSALAAGFVVALATVGAACGGSDNTDSTTAAAPAASSAAAPASTAAASTAAAAGGKVGVILPDSKSSARWETSDRPLLDDAFKAAGVESDIQNAEGDKTKMATIADQMITSGVKVLMIVNLDSRVGRGHREEGRRRRASRRSTTTA